MYSHNQIGFMLMAVLQIIEILKLRKVLKFIQLVIHISLCIKGKHLWYYR